jgi:hypothetical protein
MFNGYGAYDEPCRANNFEDDRNSSARASATSFTAGLNARRIKYDAAKIAKHIAAMYVTVHH